MGSEGELLAATRASLGRGELEESLLACRSAAARSSGPMHRALWEALRLDILVAVRARALGCEEGGDPEAAARWLGLLAREEPSRADSLVLQLDRVRGGEPEGPAARALGTASDRVTSQLIELRMDEVGSWLIGPAGRVFVRDHGGSEALEASTLASERGLWLDPVTSLTGGVRWHARASGGRLFVNDTEIASEAGAFVPAESRLRVASESRGARGCELRSQRVGNDGSGIWLEFERGFGCMGARGLLLLGEGTAGAVRFGCRQPAPFGVRALREPLSVERRRREEGGDRWQIECSAGIRPSGSPAGEGAPGKARAASTEFQIELARTGRLDLLVGDGRPPLWCSWRSLGGRP